MCILLSAIVTLTLCGCKIHDLPEDIQNQITNLSSALVYPYSTVKVDTEHKEFTEKCFDDIEIYGAKLALPMNIGDLPTDFTIDVPDYRSPEMRYNGFNIITADLRCDGQQVAMAEIMYPAAKTYNEGQIVSLSFNNYLFADSVAVKVAGEYGLMTYTRAIECFGECEQADYMIYELGDGKTIRLSYMFSYGNNDLCSAVNLTLSTIDYEL